MVSPHDQATLDEVIREISFSAAELFELLERPLNRYSDITARADCLRIIRAAIELAPTLPPK